MVVFASAIRLWSEFDPALKFVVVEPEIVVHLQFALRIPGLRQSVGVRKKITI